MYTERPRVYSIFCTCGRKMEGQENFMMWNMISTGKFASISKYTYFYMLLDQTCSSQPIFLFHRRLHLPKCELMMSFQCHVTQTIAKDPLVMSIHVIVNVYSVTLIIYQIS